MYPNSENHAHKNNMALASSSREIKCRSCSVKLLVPPDAHTVRCSLCQSITRVPRPPVDPVVAQVEDSISQAVGFVKSFLNNVSNTVASSLNSGSSGTYGYGNHYPPLPIIKPLPISSHGRKRAVLCGVSYYGRSYRLKGTVNDVKCMKYFLVQKLGFPSESILTLTEEETNPSRTPTKSNIQAALKWLVQGCQPEDSLVFHFSGHACKQPVFSKRDDVERYGEALCPVDYEAQGTIIDEEINSIIVRPLPDGARLHGIIDACYSGTILNLPFVCRMNREGYYSWDDRGQPTIPSSSAYYRGTSGGLAISISACDDYQSSADTTAFSGNGAVGALSYSFIQAVQNEPGLTYGRLLIAMRQAIREAKTGIRSNRPIATLVRKAFSPKFSEEPQLSSSTKFDIHSKPFVL